MLTFMLEAWFGFNILRIIFLTIIINIKTDFAMKSINFQGTGKVKFKPKLKCDY